MVSSTLLWIHLLFQHLCFPACFYIFFLKDSICTLASVFAVSGVSQILAPNSISPKLVLSMSAFLWLLVRHFWECPGSSCAPSPVFPHLHPLCDICTPAWECPALSFRALPDGIVIIHISFSLEYLPVITLCTSITVMYKDQPPGQ